MENTITQNFYMKLFFIKKSPFPPFLLLEKQLSFPLNPFFLIFKYTFFCLMLFFIKNEATAQENINLLNQKIDLLLEENTCSEALEKIEKIIDCKFSYSNDFLPTEKYTKAFKNTPVRRILTMLFKNTAMTFLPQGKRIILAPKIEGTLTEVTPKKKKKYTLNGYLRDARTGEELIGGTVFVYPMEVGVYSNEYGFYSITIPEGNYQIEFSYLGYKTKVESLQISSSQRIDLELKSDSNELTQVVVTGESAEKSGSLHEQNQKIDLSNLTNMPTLLGESDLVRSLESLPGVHMTGDGSGGFSVRGGNSDHNLVLLDEAPVYHLSHLLGVFSIFNPDAIKDVRLMKGSISTEFRGRLGSVLDIRMDEGSNKKFGIAGGAGLLMSRLKLEGQLFKGKGSFMVAGRRTYLDLLFKPFITVPQNDLFFYDLNSKVNFKLGKNDRFYFSAYNGRDVFRGQEDFSVVWGNNTVTGRWNHLFSNRLFCNTSIIISDFDFKSSTDLSGLFNADVQSNFALQTKINDVNLKSTFQFFQRPDLSLKFGGSLIYHRFLPGNLIDNNTGELTGGTSRRYAWESGIFGAADWQINDNWQVKAGIHLSSLGVLGSDNYFYDYDDFGNPIDSAFYRKGEVIKNWEGIEPRLSITRNFNQDTEVTFTYNRTIQYLQLLPSSFVNNPASAWLPSSKNIRPQRANQMNLGYHRQFFDKKLVGSVETFFTHRINQIAYRNGANIDLQNDLEGQITIGKSWSYGLEFALKKQAGRFKGWLSYTLSKTQDRFAKINDGRAFDANQDRPHSVSVVGVWEVREGFSVSASWSYLSGKLVTVPIGKYEVGEQIIDVYGDRNNYRLNHHHRADISATWRKEKENGFRQSWSVALYNVYFHRNPEYLYIDPLENTAQEITLFGLIPSVTYNFEF
ncbi:MAG: hypothetical protein ACI920_000199 [Saprospiraceae bacterium]|jgi:hypothetical protein